MPRTIVEAFAVGTPVVAPGLGAMTDLISTGQNGFHFEPGNARDLNRAIELLFAKDTDQLRLRRSARENFERHYTAAVSYQNLMGIYAKELGNMAAVN